MLTPKISHNTREPLSLDEHGWLVLFVALVSLIGIALLSFSVFNVPLLLCLSFAACALLRARFNINFHSEVFHWKWQFVLILVVGACLRADVYPHMMGGQDQGLYTNFAEVMLREGGLTYTDEFRLELSKELTSAYDSTRMASVRLLDPAESRMTVDFYPLHPMWMAMFSWMTESGSKTLSLLFFSLIYVWTGKKLANELFQSETAALLSALLLATNPALVFFSKFPVTEVVGLAFSSNGFLYLLLGVKSSYLPKKLLLMGISLLCFTAFFFVRIQFMIYLPFMSLLLLLMVIYDFRHAMKSLALPVVLIIFLLFGLSLFWYYQFQRNLLVSLFEGHLFKLIKYENVALIGAVLLVAFAASARAALHVNAHTLRSIASWLMLKSGYFLLLAFLASLFSILSLYRNGLMPPFPWVLDTSDPYLFRYHIFYRFILFLSPFGVLVLILSAASKQEISSNNWLLFLFLATSWIVILLQPWVPYLYYYGRYLSGDYLPYSIVALSGLLSKWLISGRRGLAIVVIVLITAYQLFFSFAQFGSIESENKGAYDDFLSAISVNDIVVSSQMTDHLIVPLRLTYGLNIIPIPESVRAIDFIKQNYSDLKALATKKGGRVLFASPTSDPLRIGRSLGGASFKYSFFSNGEHVRQNTIQAVGRIAPFFLPVVSVSKNERWLLYDATEIEIDSMDLSSFCENSISLSSDNGAALHSTSLTGFSRPESFGTWTIADYAEIQCKLREGVHPRRVIVNAHAFIHGSIEQVVDISVNDGTRNTFIFSGPQAYQDLVIPFEKNVVRSIIVRIFLRAPRSPKELGLSNDSRKLGLNVRSISFE